jgi:phosphoribosylaminoimidazole-succinocarboxamide synthase
MSLPLFNMVNLITVADPLETAFKYPRPTLPPYLKSDKLGDPHISTEHILNLGLCDLENLELIEEYSLRVNDIIRGVFYTIGINLIDFKLEFGICQKTKELVLADEISPDTCRLWDIKSNKKLDKDRFRRDLGNVEEAYVEVLTRLGLKI